MRTRNIIAVLLGLMIWSLPGYAQSKLPLSMNEAISTGLKNSKTLRIADSKVKQSKARLFEINTNKYAWLKFSGTYTRLSSVDPAIIDMHIPGVPAFNISPSILDNYSLKLSAVQPLFTGFKLSAGSDAAEFTWKATEADYNKEREDLVFTIRTSYWNLFKAIEMKKLLDENVQQVQAHVNDAKNMMNNGMVTNNDVLKLEVQLSDIKYKQVDAANGVRLAVIALNNALGIPLSTGTQITETAGLPRAGYDNLDQLLDNSYSKRAELKAAEYRIKTGEAGVTAAEAGWYPQVALVGNYNYARPNQRIFPTKDEFTGTWDASVSVSFDIWDWNSRSHQTEQAEMQLLQAKDGLSVVKDAITLEVTQNFLNMNQAKERIAISELAKQQAEDNYRMTTDKFKQGLALSSELIDAEVAWLQAKTNYTTALVDYELAVARLQKSAAETSF
ncbi:MAG: TolC family protein [Ignavibacteria bacterium]|nr:TolC family protein [Ignavibacteria bacterium]